MTTLQRTSKVPAVHVVEDDAYAREAAIKGIRDHHHKAAIGYPTGEAFLAAWTPDMRGVVRMDIRLSASGGISGDQVYKRLVDLRSHLPVVFVTGFQQSDTFFSDLVAGREYVCYLGRNQRPEIIESKLLDFFEKEPVLFEKSTKERVILRKLLLELTAGERVALDGRLRGVMGRELALRLDIVEGAFNVMVGNALHKLLDGEDFIFGIPTPPKEFTSNFLEFSNSHLKAVKEKLADGSQDMSDSAGMRLCKGILRLAEQCAEVARKLLKSCEKVLGDEQAQRDHVGLVRRAAQEHADALIELNPAFYPKRLPKTKYDAAVNTLVTSYIRDSKKFQRGFSGDPVVVIQRDVSPLCAKSGATGDASGFCQLSHLAAIELVRRLRLLSETQRVMVQEELARTSERAPGSREWPDALQLLDLDDIGQLRRLLMKNPGRDLHEYLLKILTISDEDRSWRRFIGNDQS